MAKNIQHLVVLMMENRSFDHALGFLKRANYPIDGLDGTETNPDSQGALVQVSRDAHYRGDLNPDPGHDFISVNEQIFENSQGTGSATMKGFVKAYQGKTGNVAKSHNVMRCFNPNRLPALSTLAQEFALCDRWFSSVPGPTIPNRAFAYGATSLGRVDMNFDYHGLKTIFQLLAEHNVTSKIYYHDWCLGLANGYILDHHNQFLFFFQDFKNDAKKNKLPAFSFIEPRYNDFNDQGRILPASDQHPDHHVFEGDKIIRQVYEAIRSNQQTWESTLLVITYDEHGGLFDHVPPPATVNPNPNPPPNEIFDFRRLGVRVPAVLVSPFIPKRTIINDTAPDKVFDHTSIIATARKLFLQNPNQTYLTERDRNARSFEGCLTLMNPRTDLVTIPDPSDSPAVLGGQPKPLGITAESAVTPGFSLDSTISLAYPSQHQLNDFQQVMIQQAFAFDRLSSLPTAKIAKPVSAIRTEQDAAEYLEKIRKTIESGRKRPKKQGKPKKDKAKKNESRKPRKRK